MITEDGVCRTLDELGIPYTRFAHPPVYTVAQARPFDIYRGEVHVKNLFLRSRRGDRFYLLVVPEARVVDLKDLAGRLGEKGLGMASPERLMDFLGVEPGAVGPFGLLNDTARQVVVLLDASLPSAGSVGFHPNVNTATLVISGSDLLKFLQHAAGRVEMIAF
jgi:Ala-tRNA(Pro) deacylase